MWSINTRFRGSLLREETPYPLARPLSISFRLSLCLRVSLPLSLCQSRLLASARLDGMLLCQTLHTRILECKPLIDTSYHIWHRLELKYFHLAQFLFSMLIEQLIDPEKVKMKTENLKFRRDLQDQRQKGLVGRRADLRNEESILGLEAMWEIVRKRMKNAFIIYLQINLSPPSPSFTLWTHAAHTHTYAHARVHTHTQSFLQINISQPSPSLPLWTHARAHAYTRACAHTQSFWELLLHVCKQLADARPPWPVSVHWLVILVVVAMGGGSLIVPSTAAPTTLARCLEGYSATWRRSGFVPCLGPGVFSASWAWGCAVLRHEATQATSTHAWVHAHAHLTPYHTPFPSVHTQARTHAHAHTHTHTHLTPHALHLAPCTSHLTHTRKPTPCNLLQVRGCSCFFQPLCTINLWG